MSSCAIKFEYIHYTDKLTDLTRDSLRLEFSHSFITDPAGHLLAQPWQFINADGIVSVVETAENLNAMMERRLTRRQQKWMERLFAPSDQCLACR